MTTPMPASPFLSASDGLHPLSSVAVASGIPYKPQGAAAEIQSSPDGMIASLPSGECEPSVMLACMPGKPAAASEASLSMAAAGTNAEAATDCINEIFTFARGLMRDYQPDFQALLNEISPFPMEYLPDYRLGDDDQPLFLQGAVA